MSGRRPRLSMSFRMSPATALPSGSQDTVEALFAAYIDSFIGEHWHDTRRWCLGKARLIGNAKNGLLLWPLYYKRYRGDNCSDMAGLRIGNSGRCSVPRPEHKSSHQVKSCTEKVIFFSNVSFPERETSYFSQMCHFRNQIRHI